MWVTLKQPHLSHPAGEKIQVNKKDGAALIAAGTAAKTPKDPTRKLLNQATRRIEKKVKKTLTGKVQDVIAEAQKTVGGPRKVPATAADPTDGGTKTFGNFLLRIVAGDRQGLEDVYGSKMVEWGGDVVTKAPLAELSGVTGGYTVPLQFIPQLMQAAIEASAVRMRATVIPMASRNALIPVLDLTTTQGAGFTNFLGGLVAKWTEEAATINETEPVFKQVELIARELTGLTIASNTLLADNAVALDALLTRIFGQAIAWYEDASFIGAMAPNGDGVGKPLGIVKSPAAIQYTRAAATNFQLADAVTMISKLTPQSYRAAVWIMSPTVMPKLLNLSDGSGRLAWLPWADPNAGALQKDPGLPGSPGLGVGNPRLTLLGLPVVFSEKANTLGSVGDVILADLSFYLIGDRPNIEIASSMHYKFGNNQMTWRFVHRVDGKPWIDKPITLADGVSQVSPFVVLN